MKETDDLKDIVDAQIEQQGTAAFRTKDSEVFVFTETTLLKLLEQARKNPERKVIVMVPLHRPEA